MSRININIYDYINSELDNDDLLESDEEKRRELIKMKKTFREDVFDRKENLQRRKKQKPKRISKFDLN